MFPKWICEWVMIADFGNPNFCEIWSSREGQDEIKRSIDESSLQLINILHMLEAPRSQEDVWNALKLLDRLHQSMRCSICLWTYYSLKDINTELVSQT